MRPLIEHVVTTHRTKLEGINYVDTFHVLIQRYEQMLNPPPPSETLGSSQLPEERKGLVNGNRWQGVKEMDATEQAYFDNSDEEEDVDEGIPNKRLRTSHSALTNGVGTVSDVKSALVDYPDDDEGEDDLSTALPTHRPQSVQTYPKLAPSPVLQSPPERLSEKRRREDEEEDELGKLSSTTKRRNSSAGSSPVLSNPGNNSVLRRKRSFFNAREKETGSKESGQSEARKKIAISIGGSGPKTPPSQSEEEDKMAEDG